MKYVQPARLGATLLALGLFVLQALADDVLPVLQTKTDSYANVTVVSHTATHVFVQHSRGVANIKLSDLDLTALTALGFSNKDEAVLAAAGGDPAAATARSSTNRLAALTGSVTGALADFKADFAPSAALPNLSPKVLYGILGAMAAAYLFFCYCSMLICKRTANKPGVWVWLPVLQVFPLLRAAGMSRWWFLTLFVPILAPFTSIFWSLKIARACGKGLLIAILLMLPVTNIFAYIYLAFSGGRGASKDDYAGLKPDEVEPLPA